MDDYSHSFITNEQKSKHSEKSKRKLFIFKSNFISVMESSTTNMCSIVCYQAIFRYFDFDLKEFTREKASNKKL